METSSDACIPQEGSVNLFPTALSKDAYGIQKDGGRWNRLTQAILYEFDFLGLN